MTATVCIPWRPQPDRVAAHQRVREFWDGLGYPVIEADSQPGLPWHLAEARNVAVAQCSGVVIVADADTLAEPGNIAQAVEMAAADDVVVWPFTEYCYMRRGDFLAVDSAGRRPLWTKPDSVGGVFVTSTETYWRVGGQDERLARRWGFEDNCFLAAARTLSRVERIPGRVWACAHSVADGRDWSEANPNYAWAQRYRAADGDPAAMRELIAR